MKQPDSEILTAINHVKNSLNGISIIAPDLTGKMEQFLVEVINKDRKQITLADSQGLPAIISISIGKLVINNQNQSSADEIVFDVNIYANTVNTIEQIIKQISAKFKSTLSTGDLVFLFDYPAIETYSIVANTTMLAKGKFNSGNASNCCGDKCKCKSTKKPKK
jgi:hypothetical protein